jgi:zinc-ribbon domain
MLETMYVRCAHCGYDNSPEYRFCGMCGASLAHPPVAPKAVPPESPVPAQGGNGGDGQTETVHGPSFLGLAEDPKVEFHYLYEDEQPKSHMGLVLFLLLLIGGGGFLAWQWRNNGYPFNRLSTASSAPPSDSPSKAAPPQAQEQQTHSDKPVNGVGDQPPPAVEQKTQPEGNNKTAQQPAGDNSNPPPKPEAKPEEANSQPTEQPSTAEEKNSEKPTEVAKANAPSVPEKPPRPKPQPRAPAGKPASPTTAANNTAAAPDSDLEMVGERYLYGSGLPQNCSRAESSLRTAALHGNSKAQTVLGTMYATGHCVGRDLPTAYRWFARALHQEPQNSRIATDLQVLWRQMTPQERQLAMASAQ